MVAQQCRTGPEGRGDPPSGSLGVKQNTSAGLPNVPCSWAVFECSEIFTKKYPYLAHPRSTFCGFRGRSARSAFQGTRVIALGLQSCQYTVAYSSKILVLWLYRL